MNPVKLAPIFVLVTILLAAVMVSGCTGAGSGTSATVAPGTSGAQTQRLSSPDAIVLTVNGSVSNPLQLKISDLETYTVVPVNMSAAMSGRSGNMSGNASRTRSGGFNGTYGNGASGEGGNMPPGANGYFTNGGGSMPQGAGGYYTNGGGNMLPGTDANASRMYGRGNNSMNVTGYSLNSLLAAASPAGEATNVTFVGAGGSRETLPLSVIRAQADAAIVVMGGVMLEVIVPGDPTGIAVFGLAGITVS